MELWQPVCHTTMNREAAAFHTTRWTRVCLARAESDEGRRALADLCDAYYEPVVTYLRTVLRDADTARDMSHAFFEQMLGGGTIRTADPSRGRFRSYLLGAVKHFLSNQREAAGRMKRGGGAEMVSMNETGALADVEAGDGTPDAEFDRQWAITVMTRAMGALQAECAVSGEGEFFDAVRGILVGQADRGAMTDLAAERGMSFDALRVAVHRLRKRLRDCVKSEVAGTLEDPAAVQEEMEALFAALGR